MRAVVYVGANFAGAPHQYTAQRPVTLAYREWRRPVFRQLHQIHQHGGIHVATYLQALTLASAVGVVTASATRPRRNIHQNSAMPGKATTVVMT